MKVKSVKEVQPPGGNPSKKHKRNPSLLIGAIVGIIIGFGVFKLIDFKQENKERIAQHKEKEKQKKIRQKQAKLNIPDTFTLDLINPLCFCSKFDYLSFVELDGIKPEIEPYIQETKKSKHIQTVSVYFRDLNNGHWFGINEDKKFAPASLNKVPLLLGAFKKAEGDLRFLKKSFVYNGSLEQTYLYHHPELNIPKSSLKTYQEYSVSELLEEMIINSDNEATILLLDAIGLKQMNQLKKELGYIEPIDARQDDDLITVKQFSTFFRVLFNSSVLNKKHSNQALELLSRSNYNEGIRRSIPDSILVAHKFGERDTIIINSHSEIRQLHHAGIVYYPDKPYLLCIMTKGNDKGEMEKVIYDISHKIFLSVHKQMKAIPDRKYEKDIR